jgi:hypothetical protein
MKLTNKIKDSMVEEAVNEKFDPILDASEKKLLELFYKKAVEQKILEYETAPFHIKPYLSRISGLRFRCKNGSDIILDDPFMRFCLTAEEGRYSTFIVERERYSDDDEEVAAHRKITEQKYRFQQDIQALMKAINTDKQLTELCPELCRYLPTVQENNGVLVPIALIERIKNQMKGLS